MALSVVHTHLLLVLWLSLWYTTIFYWPTGPPYVRLLSSPGPVAQSYGTLLFSTAPLAVSVVRYYLLLAHWLSLWYTLIFLWPTGPSFCTQLSSTGPLPPHVSVVHYYLLLAHWLSLWYITIFFLPTGYLYDTLLPSTGPLSISMVLYHLLLAHWLSLLCTTIFYWPTGPLFANLQYSIGQLASPGPVAPFYVTLPFSNGPLVVSLVHYIFYWPTGYLYGAQPSSTDPLILPRLLYYFLLAHWLSL